MPQHQPNQRFQPTGSGRAIAAGVLRNPVFADRAAARDPGARQLAHSTFQGRFFDFRRRHHLAFPIVIGFIGPLFWPYAYDDFVDYTFYAHAYDTFWPYAYDDLYAGMFGPYAEGYGGAYATVGQGRGAREAYAAVGRQPGGRGGPAVATALCSGQTAGLTDWPIEQIAQTVEPDDAQRAALDELKNAIAQALDILKASCPTDLPSTPTGRIEAMRARLDGMLQAVRTIRPAMETFYAALNDEQKARLNALAPAEDNPDQVRQNLTQVCNERAAGIASLPIKRIEQTVRPNEAQRGTLQALEDTASQAANLLKSDCPTYRALTAVGRLEAMEQRLDAMLRAVKTVQAALDEFYASLSDEQKERFNRLGPAQG